MKGSWKKIAVFAFAVTIMFGMGLQAQSVSRAKFTLPFDANLGQIAASNGEYVVSVDHLAANGMITFYQGIKAVGTLRPESFDGYAKTGERPQLVFIRHDGISTLRALRLPNTGTFYFFLPKKLRTLVAQQPQLIETVSVAVNGD
jgi:hypothetical protein